MMKEIKSTSELMAVSVRQGVEMKEVEAKVVLGYLEGHDYCLLMADDFTMILHDLTEGDISNNDMDYNIRQVVEFCQEMNEELLLENSSKDDPDEEYLLDLRKDELILDSLMKRTESVIPPAVQTYRVVIVEQLKKVVPVEAASWEEARMKVEDAWKSGEHVLTAEDFTGASFTLGG